MIAKPSILTLAAFVSAAMVGCSSKTKQTAAPPATTSRPVPTEPTPATTATAKPTAAPVPATRPEPVAKAPAEPKQASPLGDRVVEVDLGKYGLRAVIDIPEGATFKPTSDGVEIGYGAEGNLGIKGRKEFTLEIAFNTFDFDEIKRLQKDSAEDTEHAKANDRYFYEGASDAVSKFAIGRSFMAGDQQYIVKFNSLKTTLGPDAADVRAAHAATVRAIWKAVESLRQTEEQKAAERRRAAALEKVKEQGGQFGYANTGSRVGIYLRFNQINEENLKLLKDVPDIGLLGLYEVGDDFKPELLKTAASIPTLKGVMLKDDRFTDAHLDQLLTNPGLETLHLESGKITDAGIAKLTKFETLRKLIVHCPEVTDASVPVLLSMKHLKALDVSESKLTTEGAKKLKEARTDWDVRQ
jgi:guanyl-specific ribonuclease Sa